MNETKFYKLVGIGLFITNLILLGFLWVGKPKHPRPNMGPKENVIEKLQFNETQVAAYDELIDAHGKNIGPINDEIIQLRSKLFATLNTESTDDIDSLNMVLSELKSVVEEKHLQHFQDIKKICNDEQLVFYNELVGDLSKMFFSKPRRKPKH